MVGSLEYLKETTMNKLTLESLAKRVETLEIAISTKLPDHPRKDWRKLVGMFSS